MRPELQRAVELLNRRDPESLETALSLIQNTVFSFSMKVCGQRQDAEDTMQEVLVQSFPNLPKFENSRALVVWLYKVAKSRCLMSRRKSKFAPAKALSLDQLMPDARELQNLATPRHLSPESLAIRTQQASRLRSAVHKLPPQHRIILVLRDMEGLSDPEVAEITGLRPGTVRVRLHRARLFVRKEMSRTETSRRPSTSPRKPTTSVRPRYGQCKKMFLELSDYLDEQLDDSLCAELVKHFHDCQPCRAFLESLEGAIAQCRNVPPDLPDPSRAAQARAELLNRYALASQQLNGRRRAPLTLVP